MADNLAKMRQKVTVSTILTVLTKASLTGLAAIAILDGRLLCSGQKEGNVERYTTCMNRYNETFS
jgi:hypothetical protein